jgi:Tol biopolymer transport system component
MAALLFSLLMGAQTSGQSISVFTTNLQETTDVWVMDVSRNQFIHIQVSGHQNNIPVWSREERQIVYYPRAN